jgi:23S rRNA (guanosine2251-2'-O)-methyltransferase
MKDWLYGRNPVYETLRAGRRNVFRCLVAENAQEKGRLAEILDFCRGKKIPIERGPRARLEAIHPGSQGVALEVSGYPYVNVPDLLDLAQARGEPPLILILDALQDPQNLGTLLRTAEGVGAHGAVLPYRRTATVTPAVVNASSGASEHLLIAQANLAQAIAALKEAGVWVIGLEGSVLSMSKGSVLSMSKGSVLSMSKGSAGASLPSEIDLSGPLALVVGGEGEGMRPLVRQSCDALLRLPMRGKVESLNAAVAGSIALYLAWEARGY